MFFGPVLPGLLNRGITHTEIPAFKHIPIVLAKSTLAAVTNKH